MNAASLLIRGYEIVIGFETHAQLSTQSKIFSRAPTAFGAEPNTQACAVDLALPGTLPVMNRAAVQKAIEFGLAVGSRIAPKSVFARKNYFYPDLPKGYQISQYEIPVVQGGVVEFFLGDEKKSVRLVRAHLEEDAGKSLHEEFADQTGIDLNRAGTPLLEIVTEPDMRSSSEAVAYAKELHKIVTWIGICDGNMQEGSFRCDANVSVRKPGAALGTRREIKNLNSFKFMQQAIDFEARWQIEEIEEGRAIQQATVLFDPATGETRAMRTKEDAADYRYFPDPDLPPLVVAREWVERVRLEMGELPDAVVARYVREYADSGFSENDAREMTRSKQTMIYFQQLVNQNPPTNPKTAANWIMGELSRHLNAEDLAIEESRVSADQLAFLIVRLNDSTINNAAAKQLFDAMWIQSTTLDASGRAHHRMNLEAELGFSGSLAAQKKPSLLKVVDDWIEKLGLRQMNDAAALEKIIDEVIAANADNVAQFKAGKDKAFNALVGQVMKASKGKANPAQVNELLKKKLS